MPVRRALFIANVVTPEVTMSLTQNVGGADKWLRIAIGIALIAFIVLSDVGATWKVVAGIVAAIALVTALAGFCPLNSMLGINTARKDL